MYKYKVVVADRRFENYDIEREILEKVNAQLIIENATNQTELYEAIKDADGVLLDLIPMRSDMINRLDKCKIIARYGVGYNNVDVEAATKKGIWVSRVPSYGADEAVSDQAMALTLDCIRKTTVKHNRILAGEWDLMAKYKIHRIKGSTVGIIGFGQIGSVYAKKISGFSPKEILVYDPYLSKETIEKHQFCKKVDLDVLAKNSDIITLHCPETQETLNMINEEFISLMKKTAIIINTARGGIIDNMALAKALSDKRISAAGIDVFVENPLPMDHPYRKLENIVLSDHTGFYTEESYFSMKSQAASNIAQVLIGKKPFTPLNDL